MAFCIGEVNVNIPTDLHNSFKAITAAQGTDMTVVLLEFIEKFVAKHGAIVPRKGRRG